MEPSPQPLTPPRRASGRGCACAGLALVVLGALVAGGLRGLHWFRERQRQEVLAGLAAEGIELDPAVLRPGIAAEENGAEEILALPDPFLGLSDRVAFVAGTGPGTLWRVLEDPSHEWAVVVYEPDPDDPSCPPDVPGAARLIEARTGELEPALDAALSRPCSFPVDWSRGVDVRSPHWTRFNELSSLLVTRAGWRAWSGDAEGAWSDVERLLRLTALVDEPSYTGRAYREALAGRGVQASRDLLARGWLPGGDQAARVDALLGSFEDRDGFGRALQGELGLTEISFARDPAPGLRPAGGSGEGLRRRLLLPRWRLVYARALARLIRTVRRPPAVAVLREIQSAVSEVEGETPFLAALLPGVDRLYTRELDFVVRLRATRIALRLAAKPELPERIDDLPLDPWDPAGRPLRYARRGPGEAVLWSVGRDGVDDGAHPPDEGEFETEASPGTDICIGVRLPAPR